MLTFLLSISDESDRSRIVRLYETYHDDMIRFAKSRLRQSGMQNYEIDAEDAVQNAFVKIAKYIRKIDFTESEKTIRSYVFSIVSNEVINIVSDYRYCDDIDECEEALTAEDFIEQMNVRDSYDSIVRTIKGMDEKYSTALLYHYCCEMNVSEIAKMLALSEKTIYTRLARGRQILLNTVKGDARYEKLQ